MTRPAIPADLRRFILLAIPSVPYLEALLLMRAAADNGLDLASLAAGLYVNEATATALLLQLEHDRLIGPAETEPVRYRYAPTVEQAGLIDRLAEEYANNLVGVSMLIHTSLAARLPADLGIPKK